MHKTKSLSDCIRLRRSIRKFNDTPINAEKIEEVLHLAMYAPSPKNRQPWRFYVCSDKIKNMIAQALYDKINNENCNNSKKYLMAKETVEVIKQAPILILISYDNFAKDKISKDSDLWTISTSQYECCDILSIGACVQNILLKAEEMGLSTLWVCDILYAYDEIKNIIRIDETILSGIVLGYSDVYGTFTGRDFEKFVWLK